MDARRNHVLSYWRIDDESLRNTIQYFETVVGSMNSLRQMLWLTTFALWFGGFTFYAALVVPVANSILPDTVQFGFVTQKVTHGINALHGAFLVVATWEIVTQYRKSNRKMRWLNLLALSVFISAAALIGLLLIRVRLDAMMTGTTFQINETKGESFYGTHAIYLNLSTVAWLAGIAQLIGFTFYNCRSCHSDPSN